MWDPYLRHGLYLYIYILHAPCDILVDGYVYRRGSERERERNRDRTSFMCSCASAVKLVQLTESACSKLQQLALIESTEFSRGCHKASGSCL